MFYSCFIIALPSREVGCYKENINKNFTHNSTRISPPTSSHNINSSPNYIIQSKTQQSYWRLRTPHSTFHALYPFIKKLPPLP